MYNRTGEKCSSVNTFICHLYTPLLQNGGYDLTYRSFVYHLIPALSLQGDTEHPKGTSLQQSDTEQDRAQDQVMTNLYLKQVQYNRIQKVRGKPEKSSLQIML